MRIKRARPRSTANLSRICSHRDPRARGRATLLMRARKFSVTDTWFCSPVTGAERTGTAANRVPVNVSRLSRSNVQFRETMPPLPSSLFPIPRLGSMISVRSSLGISLFLLSFFSSFPLFLLRSRFRSSIIDHIRCREHRRKIFRSFDSGIMVMTTSNA